MGQKLDEAKGRTKEAMGDLTDDEKLKRKGKLDRASANVKGKLDDFGEKAEDFVEDARKKAEDVLERKS